MLKGRRTRKAIAATLLLIFATNTFAPTAAYALTSGPTSPESTSFEPVDTTDMVNLQTGDFTYNIPLLEIPGPEGGYPLSLSYHAGIQTNEDASWVGLGWTVNPGAISRNVNGYPDDWETPQNQYHAYWKGGSVSTYDVGISVGIANTPVSVGFGLSFSQDTYRGFGVGYSASLGMNIKGSPFGIGVTIGVSSYGDSYMSGGINTGIGSNGLNASAGIGISTNFESVTVGFSGGVGYSAASSIEGQRPMNFSLLGASISTGGNKPSFNVGGLTSVVTSSQTGIQTKTKSFGLDIPTPWYFSISLGWSKTRYWTNETTNVYTHGSLNSSGYSVTDNMAYDTYSLLEDPEVKSIVDYPDPTKLQGGAFLDFDVYNVTAQGLGGNMRPYLFQGEVMGQNRKNSDGNPLSTYFSPGPTHSTPVFRFSDDFSNSYRQDYPVYNNVDINLRLIEPPFATPTYGDATDPLGNGYGFGYGNNLAGSRYIQIGPVIKPSETSGYNKNDRYQSGMIEGFSITNESGVTYHYGLPAYAWAEEIYQEKIDQSGGATFNRSTKSNPYAYTWHLTTITGPDFVDRDGDNKAGNNDWGYWVNFEYGKWSNNYVWRNPSQGFHRDEDNEWQNCSMGKKEVYYLDAIRTRTHFAVFEKEIRNDAWGEPPQIFSKINTNERYDNTGTLNTNGSQSLRLTHIYLFNNGAEIPMKSAVTNTYSPSTRTISCSDCEQPGNVYDKSDIDNPYFSEGRTYTEGKAIRVIDLIYDYSLCQGVANNFTSVDNGKLTLKSVQFRGKHGLSILPPLQFGYEPTGDDLKNQTGVSLSATNFTTSNSLFAVGDMVMRISPATYCGVITNKSFSAGMYTYTLANSNYTGGAITTDIKTTKNPPYHKDAYDIWGEYKSDFNTTTISANENLGRQTTVAFSNAADAWSLRSIITALGGEIKIKYESDSYSSAAFQNSSTFLLSGFSDFNLSNNTISFIVSANGIKLSDFFSTGDRIDFVALQPLRYDPDPFCYGASYSVNDNTVCQNIYYLSPLVFDHDYSASQSLPGNYYYFRIIDTRQYGGCTITTIDDVNNRLTVQNGSLNSYFNYINKLEYAGGELNYTYLSTTVKTYRHLAPKTGNLIFSKLKSIPGGGVRVKEIRSENSSTGQSISTFYDYTNPIQGISSGVTSYEPTNLSLYDLNGVGTSNVFPPNYSNVPNASVGYRAIKYKRVLYNRSNSLLAISRELPPPGVMYEYVTVRTRVKNADEEETRNIPGKTVYNFEIFRKNMVGRQPLGTQQGSNSLGTYFVNRIAIKKFTGAIGNIKRIIQYDKDERKINETINHYLHDGLENLSFNEFMTQYKSRLSQFKYQGYLQEQTSEVKEVQNSGDLNGVKATLSTKEEYPVIPTGQTIINYVNGSETSSETLAYDFYSGAVTKTVETDAYGNRFMTETKPAYRVTEYSNMGLKVNAGANKNMLTQTAATWMYKVNSTNTKLGIVSAQVQTWNNNYSAQASDGSTYQQNGPYGAYGDVWRMQSSYSWLPDTKTTDGLTTVGNFSDFNFTAPSSSNVSWKKTTEITLYDVYSHSLEARDMYGNYAATRMDYGNKRVVLSGGPANYYEIAYSGVEDDCINQTGDAFVKKGDGVSSYTTAHTGVQSLKLSHGGKGLIYSVNTNKLTPGRDYTVSVWVKAPNSLPSHNVKLYYKVNNVEKEVSASSGSSTKYANDWYLINLLVKGSDITSNVTFEIGCRNDHASADVYIDDFRFQPLNASTAAYVYDGFSGEFSYVLDNNNLYTFYGYDAAGRLVATYKEKLSAGTLKISEIQYNNSPVYSNNALFAMLQKNNCPGITPGEEASYAYISVPEGQIKSLISQEDADARAAAYAQQQANSTATCWVPNIYARIEIVPISSGEYDPYAEYYNQFVEAWVKFYSDAACTVPLTLSSNLDFSVEELGTYEDMYMNVSPYYTMLGGTALSGTNGYLLGGDMMSLFGFEATYDENYSYTYLSRWNYYWTLKPVGTNYSIKEPSGYLVSPW